jgi:hypothetical protein
LLSLTKKSGAGLVEPCVWEGEIGGFIRPGALELGAYYDVDALREFWGQSSLVPIERFLCHYRAWFRNNSFAYTSTVSNGNGAMDVDAPFVLDALVAFTWSKAEQTAMGLGQHAATLETEEDDGGGGGGDDDSGGEAFMVDCTNRFVAAGLAVRSARGICARAPQCRSPAPLYKLRLRLFPRP